MTYEGAFADPARLPRVWVFPVAALRPLVKVAEGQGLRYVSRRTILDGAADFEDAWWRLREG